MNEQANGTLNLEPVKGILTQLVDFINFLVPIVFAIAFIVFIWGVFRYFIQGAASEEQRDTGKQFVVWSLVGFFLMLSLWGIVNLLTNTLSFDNNTRPCLPVFSGECAQ